MGIAAQLLDESLHQFSLFRYELGELANMSYHLQTAEVQERHQEIILAALHDQDYAKDTPWRVEEVYQALLPIPAVFRSLAAREFMDRFRGRYGTAREAPQLFSWGGWVAPPVDLQRILALSDQALLHLLSFYTLDTAGRSQVQIEGLVGGKAELASQLADAAACAPHRFLGLVGKLAAEACHSSFIQSVLRGAATHLRYRFGNLQPSSGDWSPEQPLPDGPALAERLLWFMDRYTEVWQDEWTAAQVLNGCAVAAEGADSFCRLVWHLLRLARAKRPEQDRVRFDPDKRTEVESRDLAMDAINEPRGIAATVAMELANRLADGAEAWPELLTPLLCRLASDPVASVRAGILRDLPYLLHKQPDLGWDLLGRCLTAPHVALWDLAGETFHYQLRDRFDQVAPYLDRMLAEAPGMADATWSRLSSLAVLEGKMAGEDLFRTLSTIDRPALWEGAASVFAANFGEKELVSVCRAGLLRILDGTQAEGAIMALDRTQMDHVGFQAADMGLIARLIDRIAPRPERRDFMGLPEWLANAARRDPIATLPLLESLVVKLNESLDRSAYFNGKPLIAALLEILREADDSDDRELVARAIALQDRFVGLGFSGMEEMLDKATGR